ncbi:hypothetical protein AMEX_G11107 [Astyanax mexicanus]|uniref:Uncharacterized protein n=1 Tax=Astyanax mexicanus TaxID=7994 RepID=A0A8T2LPX4_ASTMX|nr:hypothetical protein AMEX_G11107 [Astyanax mexicanus]
MDLICFCLCSVQTLNGSSKCSLQKQKKRRDHLSKRVQFDSRHNADALFSLTSLVGVWMPRGLSLPYTIGCIKTWADDGTYAKDFI